MVKNPPATIGDEGSIPRGEIPWRRKWQPTLVLLSGKSHGGRSLVFFGVAKESDTIVQQLNKNNMSSGYLKERGSGWFSLSPLSFYVMFKIVPMNPYYLYYQEKVTFKKTFIHLFIFIWLCQILVVVRAGPLLCYADSLVAANRLSCPGTCGILVPWPGVEPASSAFQGGFITTGPPGKSQI